MMTLLTGQERTIDQWSTLFRRSGLAVSGLVETKTTFTLVEGKKP